MPETTYPAATDGGRDQCRHCREWFVPGETHYEPPLPCPDFCSWLCVDNWSVTHGVEPDFDLDAEQRAFDQVEAERQSAPDLSVSKPRPRTMRMGRAYPLSSTSLFNDPAAPRDPEPTILAWLDSDDDAAMWAWARENRPPSPLDGPWRDDRSLRERVWDWTADMASLVGFWVLLIAASFVGVMFYKYVLGLTLF